MFILGGTPPLLIIDMTLSTDYFKGLNKGVPMSLTVY
jgi:hypothetical protein